MAQHATYIKDKVTKGAVRYSPAVIEPGSTPAVDRESPLGCVYFRKEIFEGKGFPETMTVSFEWEVTQ